MELIETVTVGAGGAASIEFTNIPQDGTDLLVFFSLRANLNNFDAGVWMRINNNTTTNAYVVRWLRGNGSNAESGTQTFSENFIGYLPAATSTANTFGNIAATFPNYTLAGPKSWSSDSVTENNATTANQHLFAGNWSVGGAITSLQFFSPNINFAQHSSISLYKIKKA